jgi:hypothetical protein
MFRTRPQQNERVRAPHHHPGCQANRGCEATLSGIVVIGWKEANNRVAGEISDPSETVNDGCRRALVGRLNNYPRWWNVGQFIRVKPLMSFYYRVQSSLRRDRGRKPESGLGEECLTTVQTAKLLWPIFTRDRPG